MPVLPASALAAPAAALARAAAACPGLPAPAPAALAPALRGSGGLRLLSADEVLAAAADLGSGAWQHRGHCAAPPPPASPPLVPRRLRFPSPAELAALAEPPLSELVGWTQQHEQRAQMGQQPDARGGGGGLRASDASAAAAATYAEALSRDLAAQQWQLEARSAGLHVPTLVAQLAEGLLQELLQGLVAELVAAAGSPETPRGADEE